MSFFFRASRLFLFGLLLAAVLLALKGLNWLPTALDPSGVRRYRTVEELRAGTDIRDLRLPAYVPEYLAWPPSELLGQSRPYRMSLLHFRDSSTGRIVAVIRQVEADVPDPIEPRLQPTRAESREAVELGGGAVALQSGDCKDGRPCSWISWTENGWSFLVVTTGRAAELRRIAHSMSSP